MNFLLTFTKEKIIKNNFYFIAKATATVAKSTVATVPKAKPPLKKQFSTLSMHSHRLSLAGASTTSEEELDEHEKPYDAPMRRIFGLNKPEWLFNLIGKYSKTSEKKKYFY